MVVALWIPFAVSIALMISRYVFIWYLPETRPCLEAGSDSGPTLSQSQQVSIPEHVGLSAQPLPSQKRSGASYALIFIPRKIREYSSHPLLVFSFLCFFLKRAAFTSENLIYQYASEKLHIRLYQTAWLRAVQSSAAVFVTSIGLPLSVQLCFRRQLRPLAVHLGAVRLSLVIVIFGFPCFWLANGPTFMGIGQLTTFFQTVTLIPAGILLCGLGESLEPSLDALAATVLHKSGNATFFTLNGVLDMASRLFAGPLMAKLYAIRDTDGNLLGYCFVASVVCSLSLSSYLISIDVFQIIFTFLLVCSFIIPFWSQHALMKKMGAPTSAAER